MPDAKDVSINETKATPEAIEDALGKLKEAEDQAGREKLLEDLAKSRGEIETRKAEDEAHQKKAVAEAKNAQDSQDAFDLCLKLEETMLKPAGISIDNPNENGEWVYRVVLTRTSEPLRSRAHATMKGIELLEKLKKGGLTL